jgi:hypothetical protein
MWVYSWIEVQNKGEIMLVNLFLVDFE